MINVNRAQQEADLQGLGVHYWPGVVGGELAIEAADQAANLLSDAMYRQYQPDRAKLPFLRVDAEDVLGHCLVHIEWQTTEIEDRLLAEEIKNVTGIRCEAVFSAARMLLKATGHMQGGDERELTIFQTTPLFSNRLHRDGDHRSDFIPSDDLVRYMLHLRGARQLTFASSVAPYESVVSLALAPGDAYGFMPKATYHGAEYDDLSLAIYVQTD